MLVYRFLTAVPTLLLGLAAAFTWRRQKLPPEPAGAAASIHPIGTMPSEGEQATLGQQVDEPVTKGTTWTKSVGNSGSG